MSVPSRRRTRHHTDTASLPDDSTRVVLRRRRCSEPPRRARSRRRTGLRQALLAVLVLVAAGPVWAIGAALAERVREEIVRHARTAFAVDESRAPEFATAASAVEAVEPVKQSVGLGAAGSHVNPWTAWGDRVVSSVWSPRENPYARGTASAPVRSAAAARGALAFHPDRHAASRPAVYAALAPKAMEKPATASVRPATIPGSFTWLGGLAATDPSWTTGANWMGATAPSPTGNAVIDFTFNPVSGSASNVNVNYAITSLEFQGIAGGVTDTPSYTVSGSPGVSLTIASGIIDNSANVETLTVPVVTTAAQTWSVAATGGSLVVNSAVTGAGGITKTGVGSLTLGGTGSNGFGPLNVQGGTVVFNKTGGDLAASGTITVGNAAAPGAAGSSVVRLTNDGETGVSADLTLYSDGLFDVNGHTTGLNSITMTGGELRLGAGVISIPGSPVGLTSITTNASATSALISSTNLSNNINLIAGPVSATVARGTATYDLDVQAGLYNGTLTKDGPGVMRLAGTTNDKLAVVLTDGTLALASNTALGTPDPLVMGAAPGTFTLAGGTVVADGGDRTIANPVLLSADSTVGASVDGTPRAIKFNGDFQSPDSHTLTVNNDAATTIAGTVRLDASTLTIAGTGATTISGVVSDLHTFNPGGALAKNGTGTLALSASNTYTGGTTLNAGTLDVQNDGALGTGTLTVNGGTLTNNETFSGSAVQANLANAIVLNGDLDHGQSNNYLTLGGDISLTGGTHTVSASDTGFFPGARSVVIFNGAITSATPGTGLTFANSAVDDFVVSGTTSNTYTGPTTVDNAQVYLQKTSGQTAVTGDLTVQNGGIVYTAGGQLNAAGTTNLTVNTGGTFNGSGSASAAGSEIVASLNGDTTGTVSIGNQVVRGTLSVGQGTMNGLLQDGTVNLDAVATRPALSGLTGGALVKDTEGTLTLTHNNTYSGGTTVAAGKLFIDNVPSDGVGSGTGSGPVFVNPTTTGTWLGGTGQIAGDTTVGGFAPLGMGMVRPQLSPGMATLTPGEAGPGILTFNASLTLTSGISTTEIDLAGTDPGTGYDQVKVGTNLMAGGNLTLTLGTGFRPKVGDRFFVFDLTGAGSVTGTFDNAGTGGTFMDTLGDVYQINYADNAGDGAVGNDVSLLVIGVPEPGTWAWVALGAAGMVLARRAGRGRAGETTVG